MFENALQALVQYECAAHWELIAAKIETREGQYLQVMCGAFAGPFNSLQNLLAFECPLSESSIRSYGVRRSHGTFPCYKLYIMLAGVLNLRWCIFPNQCLTTSKLSWCNIILTTAEIDEHHQCEYHQ